MVESAGENERSNSVHGEAADKVEVEFERRREGRSPASAPTLHAVLYRMISTVLFPDFSSRASGKPLARQIKISLTDDGLVLREASRIGRHILLWTHRGSPLRALLVVSIEFEFLLLTFLGYLVGIIYAIQMIARIGLQVQLRVRR